MKKLFSTRCSDTSFNIATLLLRLGFGLLMLLNHGYSKLSNYPGMLQKFKDPTGLLSNSVALAMTVFAEFFCAAFIILGLFTRLACIPLIIAMGVAFFIVHNGKFAPGPGSGEMALLYLTAFLALLFTGPGKISLDRFIGK
jgi:putative oxidoreductase